MDSEKEKIVNKNLLRKKKTLLNAMKRDIKNLERKIKYNKFVENNQKTVKVLKISQKTLQIITPYIVVIAFTFTAFNCFNVTPFLRNKQKHYLKIKKEIDSLKNIHYIEQYDDFDSDVNIISYYGKWTKIKDNLYVREIKDYKLNYIDEEKIDKLINNPNVSLIDILGNPIKERWEKVENLILNEEENIPLLKAIIYSFDENNMVILEESFENNFGYTLLWFLLTFIFLCETNIIFKTKIKKYLEDIKKIKSEDVTTDISEIEEKLKIRKKNYERLTR